MPYYSIRSGKRFPVKLSLSDIKKLFITIYNHFNKLNYFYECFGYTCYDIGDVCGDLGELESINSNLWLKIGRDDLWPIDQKIDSYSENDLFDMIEFLYDCVSVPSDGTYHGYNDCGWHDFKKFDKTPARVEYRKKVNEILAKYKEGYELSDEGYILILAECGLD